MAKTGGEADNWWRHFVRDMRLVLIITVAVSVVLIITVPFYRQSPGYVVASIIIMTVYGGSIGCVMTLFYGRYGERIAAQRPLLNWLLLIGTLIMLPIILGYFAFVFWVFRGKVREGEHYHH